MAESGSVEATRRTAWDVTIGSTAAGFCDTVDLTGLKVETDDIMVGSLGKAVLGKRVVGLTGTLKIQLRECTSAKLAAACTWALATNVVPAAGVDMYAVAVALKFHPRDLDATSAKTEDLNLVKCIPAGPPLLKRDGKGDDLWEVEFTPLPDRSKFPAIYYGYVGATAPS